MCRGRAALLHLTWCGPGVQMPKPLGSISCGCCVGRCIRPLTLEESSAPRSNYSAPQTSTASTHFRKWTDSSMHRTKVRLISPIAARLAATPSRVPTHCHLSAPTHPAPIATAFETATSYHTRLRAHPQPCLVVAGIRVMGYEAQGRGHGESLDPRTSGR